MQPETKFINKIHKQLPRWVYRWKINKLYNNEVVDCWYAGENSKHLWVEYKWISTLPVKETTCIVPDLSAKQIIWLQDKSKRGIPVSVIIGSPEGGVVMLSPAEWIHGVSKAEFRSRMCSVEVLALWITAALAHGTGNDRNNSTHHSEGSCTRSSAEQYLENEKGTPGFDPGQSS